VAEKIPACFLADLIHAQMSTGNFGKMASAAIAWAKHKGLHDDAALFANLQQQVADYYAQSSDGTIRIVFKPDQ
jgi:hypothetical protein